jgi:hypothetical protein
MKKLWLSLDGSSYILRTCGPTSQDLRSLEKQVSFTITFILLFGEELKAKF